MVDFDGVGLTDLGTHHLRDLERPEQLFQLSAEGLEVDFPAVRGLESYRGNLPTQRSGFIGRDAFMEQVTVALGESRLVTLTGVGGVGKTRAAVQVAADLLPEFSHGVWLVELAAVNERDGVEEALAAALSIRRQPGLVILDTILGQLRSRDLLLILDNCEHVLDDVSELVEDLLEALRSVANSGHEPGRFGSRRRANPGSAVAGPSLG